MIEGPLKVDCGCYAVCYTRYEPELKLPCIICSYMYLFQELLHKSTWDLKEMYNHVENLYKQAQIMKVLMDREGRYMRVNDITVEDHVENLYRSAGSHLKW